MSNDTITVEVAYARPDKQMILTVTGEAGLTVLEAAKRSGITEHFPEINLESAKMGVFAKLEKPDTVLSDGDRVEIYRELIADPKAARKNKAAAGKGAAAKKKAVPRKKPKTEKSPAEEKPATEAANDAG